MELEKDEAPVSVTLIKPTAIDTPYTEHARNYMDVEPKHPPPVYAPKVVARKRRRPNNGCAGAYFMKSAPAQRVPRRWQRGRPAPVRGMR